MKKLILGMMMGILLISMVSASFTTLGTFKQGDNVTIRQLCASCSYNNITSIVYPNGSLAQDELVMVADGSEYTFGFDKTDIKGEYFVNGFGDLDGTKTVWAYTFDITSTGGKFNTQSAIFYIGIMAVLAFLFVICLATVRALPTDDIRDNEGTIMALSTAKHFKLPVIALAWGLLIMISYLAMNVANAYLVTDLVVNIFHVIFLILMWSAIIGIPVLFWFMAANFIKDVAIKRMIERNIM